MVSIAHLVTAEPDQRALALAMSPPQSRALTEMRGEHPGRSYSPLHLHAISGTLDVDVRDGALRWSLHISAGGRLL